MAELLLEFLSEEIPARLQARAAADLRRLMTERLGQADLAFTAAESHVTPRRLVLVVDGLPEKQPDVSEERKGPKLGAPDKAIQGFLKANGLATVQDAEVRETPKGSFYFAVRQVPGRATAQVLPDLIFEVVRALPWPRSMRWGTTKDRWVRPLWSVVGVFDGASLPAALIFGEEPGTGPDADPNTIWFGKTTTGHRFLAPELIQVTSFADYRDKLRAAKVILDREERRRIIAERAAELAAAEGLSVRDDPDLLDEVVGLVEWPVVLMGTIDEAFMTLPPEVLTTTMRSHQKYFSLLKPDGTLANRFLLAANMETPDGGRTIVAGNERVLRARLADARFFWDQDRKRSLASRAPELARIVFHAKLGSLDQKVDRVQALAAEIAAHVPGADRDRVRSAARLAKADLTSGMVGEFPELQGVMGRYYALNDGEAPEVAEAIAEHYAPLGPGDRCPSAPVSVSVALADKIDTLVGFFAIDERPTGSKDPFALRRAALGVIRLIVENGLRLPLTKIFQTAQGLYRGVDGPAVAEPLLDFFADRLKVALKDKGVRHDLVASVFALGGEDDLVRLLERVKALESFLATDDGANLLVAYRRAANIVRIEQKKDKKSYDGAPASDHFRQNEETVLHDSLTESAKASSLLLEDEDFSGAMSELARLRAPVDAFFDEVMVNAEDPQLRENRLRLLARIGATLGQVADFSRIEG
jgi:glycyl-tRNA synthetase beta chain